MLLGNFTFSRTVRSARRFENWKIKPSLSFLNEEILLSFNLLVSTPSMNTLPFVGLSKSPIMFNSVDFPEPDLPSTSTNSPFFTLNETSRKALTWVSPSPYVLSRFLISSTLDSSYRLHW